MENLHITCDNLEQRQNVFDVLTGMGFKSSSFDGEWLNIQTDTGCKEWITWTFTNEYLPNTKQLTYTQFMEKYEMLQQKVNEALATGYTKQTLSLALGHHKQYIARLLQSGIQNERVIQEIDILLGNKVVVDSSVLKELDHKNQVLDKRNDKYNMLEAEYNALSKKYEELESKNANVFSDWLVLASMRITAENKLRKERTICAITVIVLLFITFIH